MHWAWGVDGVEQLVRHRQPVVATDVGELGALVRRHGVGELYPPGDATGLLAALQRARARYPELVAAVRSAAPHLSWPADADVLRGVYADLAAAPKPRPAGGRTLS
jgi:glycogen synthase